MTTTLDWRLELEQTPSEVWAVIADTDGFNRAAGLDFDFERVDGVMRGKTRVAGIASTWEETPITWERPRTFVSKRSYDTGPIQTATATCRLTPRESGGTTLEYQVELRPRNVLLSLPVRALAATLIRPGLYRALMAVRAVVEGERLTVDPPPPLTPEQQEALEASLEPIDTRVAAVLRRRVEEDSLPAQFAMRPLQIAAEEGLEAEDVLRECLLASTSGALSLDLQILCPRCRGAHQRGTVIELKAEGVHCPTCDIHYDGRLSENMEVVFAPGKRVRDVEVPVDCIFSPNKTPHVASKVRIKAERVTTWEVDLEPGGYRLEGPHGDTWIVADPTCDSDRVFVDLKPSGVMPTGLRVRPGRVRITARNRDDDWATVAVRSRWRPQHSLTVGEMFAFPSAREVLPEGVTAGLDTRIEPGVVLAIEGPPRAIQRAQQLLESPVTEVVDNGLVLLVCPDVWLAMDEVVRLGQAQEFVSVGVASGIVVTLSKDATRSIGGPAVEAARKVMQQVGRPGIGVQPEMLHEASEALGDRCQIVERGPLAALLAFPATAPDDLHPAADTEDQVPERIGSYQVLRALAPGVFQASDAKERRWVVRLGTPSPTPELSPERTQVFFAEGHIAHTHRHRNLVEVFDWGEHDGRLFVVQELLVGESLDEVLKRKRKLDRKQVERILTGLSKALTALAEAGLQRLVRPSQVMLLAEPTDVPHAVKLLDHGLLRDGPPAGETCDVRTDVYALAALAYRMLTGMPAWRGDALSEEALRRLGVAPDKLEWGRVPVPWVPLIQRALALEAEERFEDPEALVRALRTVD